VAPILFQTLKGVANDFVAVHVRALSHQELVLRQSAHSVDCSLSGASRGRNAPRDLMGLEVAAQDRGFLEAANPGEVARHRVEFQPQKRWEANGRSLTNVAEPAYRDAPG
jgi:hypothetical protein